MKKKNLLLLLLIVLVLGLSIILYKEKEEIKTIKSEKQLLNIYESNEYASMSTFERVLTLPFSILFEDSYVYRGRKYYYIEDYAVNDVAETSGMVKSSAPTKDYSKTNIQVEGVDEADIIKTDGDYIYSISEDNVVITNVKDPENIKIESKISDSTIPSDLLLYEDKLVIISSDFTNRSNMNSLVKIYNINDKENPKLEKSFELMEPYFTTRCIEGRLYVFSKGVLRKEKESIERKYKEDNQTKEISLNQIKYLKEKPTNIQTLIAEVDLNNIKDVNLNSYLMDVSNSYVSKDNIYLLDTDYYNDKIKLSSLFTWKGIIGFFESVDQEYEENTHIYKFHMDKKKGVTLKATTDIEGSIINQYSLDEKDKELRIALETDEGTRIAILDENLKLVGETEKVAEGERMHASRFIGDKAYLVTFKNTDPLFVIDLSDSKNPKVLGELKIPGYSTYLHPYDENHLIGIGMDTKEQINRDDKGNVTSSWTTITGMKMALFDISDVNNPKEVTKTTIGDSRTVSAILTNPKALLFSKEKELLAIPVNNYEDDFKVEEAETYEEEEDYYRDYNKNRVAEGYFVYHIDLDTGFTLKGTITHKKEQSKYYYYYYYQSKLLRGVYIDDNLYTVSEDEIKVNDLEDLKEISSLKVKEN